ncbi:Fungal specific transcription factor domain [Ceratobasidium sp. AG-Ba]|nr:Fungal specific transcription factor domain [Ceratobasidium sp. AG-Ba]QRW10662.1 Fungal specific transcription factor domain [Ceratobasidium sp. AG-Ba]
MVYQRYDYGSAPYISPDVAWNLERIDDLLDLSNYLSTFRDANASGDSSNESIAPSHPHDPYAGAHYPPVVTQVPLINISSADAAMVQEYNGSVDPTLISFGQPLHESQHVPVDINEQWEQYVGTRLYPVSPSPPMIPNHPLPAPEIQFPVPGPNPHPPHSPRRRIPKPSIGPDRRPRELSSSKTMSPAEAAKHLKEKVKEAHQTCQNCRKGKTKCRPSAVPDQCATCLSQKKTCIPSENRLKPPPPTVSSLEKKIRMLFAQIEEKMAALNGGAQPFFGQNHGPGLDGKSCDCPGGNHKPGCRIADPVTLCMRAKLMELRNPDDEDDDFDNQDVDMGGSGGGSESDDHLSTSSMNLVTPMPPSGTPFGMFFELAQQLGSPTSEHPPKGSPVSAPIGLAGADYFTPGPAAHPEIRRIMIEQGKLPSYLIQKRISPADCTRLFDLFMKYWNVSVSVLDPKLHTAKYVLARFLAVAARNDDKEKDFYSILMKEARALAGEAFFEGWKSIEKVQAFILLAMFPAPSRRHDEERTWLYLGCAIRMAMDLDLNHAAEKPFANERAEREYLNRVRTWLICHNLEVSYGTKTGKPITLQEDDMILSSKMWWKSSVYNTPYDIHLCAFTQICMIFHKYQRKLVPDSNGRVPYITDVLELAHQFTKEIDDFQIYFEKLFAEEPPQEEVEACKYRAHVRYTAHYFRLVIYSHCYRQSSVQGIQPGDPILLYCIDAASQLVQALTDHHAHSTYFKFSAEGWFTFGAFAGAFMIKLLCPQAAPVIDHAQHHHLRTLIIQLIAAYRSPQVVIDEQHTPHIYAEFLSRLLARADELNGVTEEVAQAPKPDMDELFAPIPLLHALSD